MLSPLVSIGLPVFNGDAYLEVALASLVNQTYENLEIIICDNASTDGTAEIVEKFARKDGRIKYYRQVKNMGATYNYNDTFKKSTGKYFKWAAHDDVLDEVYIERCVTALEKSDEVVVVQALSGEIDDQGQHTDRDYTASGDILPYDIGAVDRYKVLIQKRGAWIRIFGVIRSDVLSDTPLIQNYVGSDLTLLGILGLKGKMHDVDEELFWRRQHANTSTTGQYKSRRKRLVWFDGSAGYKPNLPEWKLNIEMLRSIKNEDISFIEKVKCARSIIGRMYIKKRLLVEDVLFVVLDLFRVLILRKKYLPKSIA